jgi:hypothetical protein
MSDQFLTGFILGFAACFSGIALFNVFAVALMWKIQNMEKKDKE